MHTKIYPLLFMLLQFSVGLLGYASVEYLNHQIIKSRGALCRFDDALVRILILGTNNYSVM